jgi:DNA-binding NtrC family response regulator
MSPSKSDHRREIDSFGLRGIRVLVVEDSWHVGVALKRLLQAHGADVSGPVATAADAERLLSEDALDVALVDLNLRGGELANALMDRLYDRGVPTIVVSGYAAAPVALEKAAAILPKPISEERLIESMRLVTAARKAPR